MSLEAYIWAAELPLSACSSTAFRVLLKLADGADKFGRTAWRSKADMGLELGCSTRTIQRALAELLEAELIVEGDQRFVAHIRADRRPTVYDLMTPARLLSDRFEGSQRGDSSVSPYPVDNSLRGDRSGSNGETTVVAHRTVIEPRTRSLNVSTDTRASHVHRFDPISGYCEWCDAREDRQEEAGPWRTTGTSSIPSPATVPDARSATTDGSS